ncbi:SDR family NAD(P)-dependent oxidoreductase [bacterium]|nr:SDR family NAD(P)-dependent oxidoreductase [bacterium]
MRHAFITGSAGFIGFYLAELLLQEGWSVTGLDGLTDYYDVRLKHRRLQMLGQHKNFHSITAMLEDETAVMDSVAQAKPDVIVHLAAQAGVRYSLENPRAYIESNVLGTFNVMEAARVHGVTHLMMASTSSVYGANTRMPFHENDKADTPLTIYAASKKANEAMAHSYAHLWDIPTTMFRFFTVYGAWGRPDLVLYKFVDAMLEGRPIDIYNNGDMYRDFTHVKDLVRGIRLLMDVPPVRPTCASDIMEGDSLSPVAPHRVVNIGNSDKVRLMDFIDAIEQSLGVKAIRNYMPMQPGDVPATWADTSLLQKLTNYRPQTDFRAGVAQFVTWFKSYKAELEAEDLHGLESQA